ncbi:MAG: MBL fold metallo-hydrolase [Magnetococcales bacterium]|nr:MBL fold metallo-hydrolase [Nitrospirota bacterium]
MLENIHWLGHASFRITGEKVIYVDPWEIKNPLPAGVILITHEHFDHCSPADVQKMKTLKNIDVALVPVSGTYVMTAEEAVNAVKDINPKVAAIPMHYGKIVGTKADAQRFAQGLKGVANVVIMDAE